MNAALKAQLNHAPDFLAEVAGRTRSANPKRSKNADRLLWLAFVGDTLVIVAAAFLALWLRFGGHAGLATWRSYAGCITLGSVALMTLIASLGIYDRHLLLHFTLSVRRIGKAWMIWTCGVLICTALVNFEPSISRGFLVLFSGGAALGLLAWRWMFHRLCRGRSFAPSLRERVLLVGWNSDAALLAKNMREERAGSYELIGWLPSPQQSPDVSAAGVACLGPYEELVSVLRYSLIDVVIFTDHHARRDDILDVAGVCERELVQFQLVPSYFQILLSGLHLHTFSGLPLLGVSKLPLNQLENRVVKRVFDIIGGAIGLVLAAPIIAIFGMLVYLESPGKIFYHQRRLGRKGEPFHLIKIRSMRLDAEKDGRVGWSTKVDDRRLKIGSLMRKYNVDELPQFWNVLKGELSLVGPRPERPELIAGFKHEIANYNARHTVKPGLTGWAQIHGLRGDTCLTERIRHDLYYMENWSLGLDVQIMFLTFFKHANAC